VLCDAGDAETLEVALRSLPQARAVVIETACAEGHDDDDLSALVQADQAAYIYFTSGSTGEPKGAMCEHAGMLNHLLAKIEDLEVREGEVVAQTAPQCFDISLWQLLAPLLVGGKTVLIEQEAILDVGRFLDELTMHRVGVAQVVPSYLEVVLAHLEAHPRPLPDLRCLSVTGEALKKELAARWFAAMPGVALVNAYGLTETSDDVTHEVMRTVPEYERVPLGRPVRNARVYIVDENLSPVPLGAPGEIVFAGVCVGRGYVNDPQRSASAFLADPHRPGQRLYRSGDFGRWLPDGRLEFLGRRDAQVKIRGFRIEIGEIENALLGVPGIRDGAVVVAERAAHGKHLVAFYTGAGPISPVALRRRLAETLPEYMVPSVLHWCEGLPLTANSKIDRKALTVLAGQLASGESTDQAPATEAERRLASAWAQVLGIAETEIGRGDDFFDLGGTSLSGVKLAIKLGRAVSLKDIVAHPVLAELAVVLQRNAEAAAAPAERALVSVDN
jgi:amino acid adenylation domain-containing protein